MAIGISPEKLEFNLKKNETVSRSIFLQNLDREEQTVNVQAAKFQNLININPSQITLPPQEIVPIEITVAGKKDFQTELEISTLSAKTMGLAIQGGVKIPVNVKVENDLNYFLIFGALIVGFLIYKFVARRFIGKKSP